MSNTEKTPKKEYKKPELKQVPLKPEEAVLGFCKTSGTRGPARSGCSVPVACSRLGS
ncbi:MAG: hypothetical protein GY868_16140 [Deltaproteobacteria bacterium]|nr:hypothetical protein [Deltaproteobacteria bacterium]